jgi:polysaccharide biosynthesis protein PslG
MPPAVLRPLIGVNAHPLQNAYAIYPPSRVLDQVAELGASVVRIDVPWDWLEWTAPGVEGWDDEENHRLDAFVDAAQERDLQVLAVVQDTPCWASGDPTKVCSPADMRYNWRAPPADPGDFATFLTRVVSRYRGRIQYWEIWNEPNLPHFWTHPDPVAYTRLLQAAYPAIKAADPLATVLAGALAPVDPGEDGYPTLAFVDAMYAAGAKGSFDALSFHPYSDGSPLTQAGRTAAIHHFALSVPALHERMLRAGDAHPIWLTEAGWASVPADGRQCPAAGGLTSEVDQARFVAAEERAVRGWGFVDGLIWYELFDRGGGMSCDPEDHFGLLYHDLSPKPAATSLEQI